MKKVNPILRITLILGLVLLNIGCDQASKIAVRSNLEYNERVSIIGDSFTMIKVENTGAFLSFGDDWPGFARIALLKILPMLIMVWLMVMAFRSKLSRIGLFGLTAIIGGGVGNMIDRLAYDSVTDFLYIDLGFFETGIFNLADVSIMVGIGLLLLHYLKDLRKPKANTPSVA